MEKDISAPLAVLFLVWSSCRLKQLNQSPNMTKHDAPLTALHSSFGQCSLSFAFFFCHSSVHSRRSVAPIPAWWWWWRAQSVSPTQPAPQTSTHTSPLLPEGRTLDPCATRISVRCLASARRPSDASLLTGSKGGSSTSMFNSLLLAKHQLGNRWARAERHVTWKQSNAARLIIIMLRQDGICSAA